MDERRVAAAIDFAASLPVPEQCPPRIREVAAPYVTSVRETLERAHWNGATGSTIVTAFSDAVDELVRFIVDVTRIRFEHRYARGAGQRCTVIAQGGYGRRELNPWSDVDILIVYPGRITPYVETVSERLVQTLFDAGLQAGWAVRTLRDCLDQAAADLTVKTTLLDGRVVAGSRELGSQFTEAVQDVLVRRDPGGFVRAKLAESRERHRRLGDSVFLLEPDVKEGMGGLRDLHSLLWIARVVRGLVRIEDLGESAVASQEEQEELLEAREFLLRVRNALHFLARAKQDKLSFESQEIIAERFGYRAANGSSASDLFMREYYTRAAIIARTSHDIIERLTAPPEPSSVFGRLGARTLRPGVSIVAGQLVAGEEVFERDPLELLRVFVDAQRAGVPLSSRTREAVRRRANSLTSEDASSPEARELFLAILKAPDGVYRTLGELNRLGVLGRLIPEFGRLFCMVQHDFYHIYTVDEHSLIGIRELERLREGEFASESPLLTEVMRDCDRPEILFLAMMFHDLGKGYGGDHDERGAAMVRLIGRRLGLDWDDRRALEFLVRYHLLMSTLAQSRDIDDPHLVAEFVRRVGTIDNLRNLYLLTFADMRAVGPKIWNSWRDHLLGELYERALEVFETGAVTEKNLEARVRRAKRRLLSEAAGPDEAERMARFLDAMPASYLLANTSDRIIEHWRLFESRAGGRFRCGVAHFPRRGFSELTIVTDDQPGLFVRLAGLLTAHRLGVGSAKIVTATAGFVIDTFRIDHADVEGDPQSPERWARLLDDIDAALAGRLDVDALVAEMRRTTPAPLAVRKARQRVLTKVEIDNQVSRDFTVIDVYAADRPGLLFTIASCIYHLGLVIHSAKITTRVNQVLDVFYVTETGGGKVTDPERHREIVDIILDRVQVSEDGMEAAAAPTSRPG
ncbi:MAG: [protein-PII] uridylyltransferase [Deltaproteobacteria bacterium]|nr:MAG: [protein-PII] uridylyltransferase [Deltaproteobacteria bacterium]